MKKRLSLHDKALLAMREAVRDVIEQHKKARLPLAIWDYKAKKVVFISPEAALRKFKKETGQKGPDESHSRKSR